MSHSVKVVVISDGVSSLVAARELQREGHKVVVFEKSSRVGGTWVYDSKIDSDPLSIDPTREIVHSSVYQSLRTNLSRALIGFLDYPFVKRETTDPRTFSGHEEVLRFIEEFASVFRIHELTRFETEVVKVKEEEEKEEGWVVESRATQGDDSVSREVFDAVVVCSGHFVEPRLGEVPGIETWRGFQTHSHNYRVPQHFHGQIKCIYEDGLVAFEDGFSIHADSIVHCTGYKYHMPYLETNEVLSIDDNRVGPLYKHVFPPTLAPRLSFTGLTYKDPFFHISELQAKWVARVLSGKVMLPTEEKMMESIQEYYQFMEENGLPKRYTHSLRPFQADYKHWLVEQIGLPPLEDWREAMYSQCFKKLIEKNESYRDEWDDAFWDAIIQSASAN